MKEQCDCNCPAAAMIAVRLSSGVLNFCQHHFDEHAKALDDAGARVQAIIQPASH